MIENCIGKISLPLGLGLNFKINEKDYKVPMVIEEPSVIAAASGAAKFIRDKGTGFITTSTDPVMIGQIQVLDIDPELASAKVNQFSDRIIAEANKYCQRMVKRGGGVKGIATKIVSVDDDVIELSKMVLKRPNMLIVELAVNVCDSMGANKVNTICEGVAPFIDEVTGGRTHLRILSNLCKYRVSSSRFSIPVEKMNHKSFTGYQVCKKILEAYLFAKADPFRAVTHNKGVMNGVSATALACGQDWRAIESAAHSCTAILGKNNKYSPITNYNLRKADDG
jgi:degradative hydroxymethylglutaryl-CoA reductase